MYKGMRRGVYNAFHFYSLLVYTLTFTSGPNNPPGDNRYDKRRPYPFYSIHSIVSIQSNPFSVLPLSFYHLTHQLRDPHEYVPPLGLSTCLTRAPLSVWCPRNECCSP